MDTEENEVVLKQYANLISTNYEKAVEILNKCNYKTTVDSLTIANVLGLENHNEYNVFIYRKPLLLSGFFYFYIENKEKVCKMIIKT